MVTVAEELPFVAVVADNFLKTACSNCFIAKLDYTLNQFYPSANLKKCARCHIIHYCSKKCQREDWNHHKNECTFLVKAKFCPEEFTRFVSRAIICIKKGDLPVAFNGRTFDDLMDHVDDIMANSMLHHYVNTLYSNLLNFMGADNVPSKEEVISIYGKLRTNAMTINSSDGLETVGRGLYIGLSVQDHSCRPDCVYTFIGPKAVLRAKNPNAKYSKDLTYTYLDVTLPKKKRQERLQFTHFFHCQCERCMDEEEDLWERSGKSSCCPDGVVLPRDNGKPLVCSKCGKKSSLTLEQINDANEELEMFCDDKKRRHLLQRITSLSDVNAYKKLFDKIETILSPYNLYLSHNVEVKGIILGRFNLIDAIERIRFMQAKEKIMERYAPFTNEIVVVKRCVFIGERALLIERPTKDQFHKAVLAGERVCAASKKICGPEYPLTKDVQVLLNDTIQFKNFI